MPADTHRHVIHLKNIYLHIYTYASLLVAFWIVSIDLYVAIAVESVEMGGGGGGVD